MSSDAWSEIALEQKQYLSFSRLFEIEGLHYCIAVRDIDSYFDKVASGELLHLATSYPMKLAQLAGGLGIYMYNSIQVRGSSEAMPGLIGVDAIFDLIKSGSTLQANQLMPIIYATETIFIGKVTRK